MMYEAVGMVETFVETNTELNYKSALGLLIEKFDGNSEIIINEISFCNGICTVKAFVKTVVKFRSNEKELAQNAKKALGKRAGKARLFLVSITEQVGQ